MTLLPDAIWTDAAAVWPVKVVSRETDGPRILSNFDPATRTNFVTEHDSLTQLHLVCVGCDQSVFPLAPGTGEAFIVMISDVLAGILAHIRRSHPDVVAS